MLKALKIKRLKSRHWQDMSEYLLDQNVLKYTNLKAFKSRLIVKSFIKQLVKDPEQHNFALMVYGKNIGWLQLFDFNKNTINLSCIINPNFQGMGIGHAAMNFLISFAFINYYGTSLETNVSSKNIAFINLLKKCGFKQKRKQTKKITYYYELD